MYENNCLFIHFVDAETPHVVNPMINKKHRNFRTHPFYKKKSLNLSGGKKIHHEFIRLITKKENKKSVKLVKNRKQY